MRLRWLFEATISVACQLFLTSFYTFSCTCLSQSTVYALSLGRSVRSQECNKIRSYTMLITLWPRITRRPRVPACTVLTSKGPHQLSMPNLLHYKGIRECFDTGQSCVYRRGARTNFPLPKDIEGLWANDINI